MPGVLSAALLSTCMITTAEACSINAIPNTAAVIRPQFSHHQHEQALPYTCCLDSCWVVTHRRPAAAACGGHFDLSFVLAVSQVSQATLRQPEGTQKDQRFGRTRRPGQVLLVRIQLYCMLSVSLDQDADVLGIGASWANKQPQDAGCAVLYARACRAGSGSLVCQHRRESRRDKRGTVA